MVQNCRSELKPANTTLSGIVPSRGTKAEEKQILEVMM
jgi:hypothetical protein